MPLTPLSRVLDLVLNFKFVDFNGLWVGRVEAPQLLRAAVCSGVLDGIDWLLPRGPLNSPRARPLRAAKMRLHVLVAQACASCVRLRDVAASVKLRDRSASAHWRLTGALALDSSE